MGLEGLISSDPSMPLAKCRASKIRFSDSLLAELFNIGVDGADSESISSRSDDICCNEFFNSANCS